jgi:hypothetical protein
MYKIIRNEKTNAECGVKRISDGACIPFDPDNTDYQAYLAWVEAGGVPLPAEEA